MTTEGQLQVSAFSQNRIPTQPYSPYPSQRDHFRDPDAADHLQHQPAGSLMRGYSFLANQIYRSVSNPLYKLVRSVEDTVGGDCTSKHPEESFQIGYRVYEEAANLKLESKGNFEGDCGGKLRGQHDLFLNQMHQQQQDISAWETNSNAMGVQPWYPKVGEEASQPSVEAYNRGKNLSTAHGSRGEGLKSQTPPSQLTPPSKGDDVFRQQKQKPQPPIRYQQPYYHGWTESNSSIANATACYPQQQFHISTATISDASVAHQVNEEVSFPSRSSNATETPSCPGCCVQPTQEMAPCQEAGAEVHNGLCLVDSMGTLPRYLTTGLWPPAINPSKLEWNGGSCVSEADARLLDMNRFYGDANYSMAGCGTGTVYSGYVGDAKDTSDFFFTPSYYSAAGEAVFRHKAEAHRLAVAAAVSAADYDPRELEAFAERFKQRRIKLGVTQADVGKALGRLNLVGVGSFSQSTICRFESLTLSHNNMLALKPILRAWLDEAEHEAAGRLKDPNANDVEEDDKKRKRTSITDSEKRSLEAFFGIQPRPSSEKIAQIAEKLNLKKNVVRVWFCNQRQKQKRMKFSTVGLLHQVNGI